VSDASVDALGPLAGSVAARVSYQGYIEDSSGTPLSGSHTLTFQLYDDPSGGSQIGTDIVESAVDVDRGVFTTYLGVPPATFNGRALWLRIGVDGEWLSPRQEIVPAPYALSLRPGARVEGSDTEPMVTVVNLGAGAAVRAQGSTVGIEGAGMTGVSGEGDVGVHGAGLVGVRGTSELGHGIEGTSDASSGAYGSSLSSYGVEGESQLDYGVYGHSSGGFAAGVGGGGATGVFGGGTLVGVSGYSESGNATGVLGTVTGIGGTGVSGSASGIDGAGVHGESEFGPGVVATGEIGVRATGTTGPAIVANGSIGVDAEGTAGSGVRGTGVTGVEGDGDDFGVDGTGGQVGVRGQSPSGFGVRAQSSGQWLTGAALYAENDNPVHGMTAHLKNASDYHTAQVENTGTGGALYLKNAGDQSGAGGGDFITAVGSGAEWQFRVTSAGQARSDVGFATPAEDFAEMLPADSGLEPGDVLVIGTGGRLQLSRVAHDTAVAGVFSTAPGFVGGEPLQGTAAGRIPLAIVGIVPVKASAEGGPISPGDLLVSSATPGHAMRAGPNPPQATVIGKALGNLRSGTGVIRMLATLQ
jgi:hypothetical protein